MTKAFIRCLTLAFAGSCLLPVTTSLGALLESENPIPLYRTVLSLLTFLTVVLVFDRFLGRITPIVEEDGRAQVVHAETIPDRCAGVGETVLIVSGSSARMASGLKDCPVDAAIVGIIDAVELSE